MHAHIINRTEDLVAFRTEWNRLYDSVPEDTVLFSSWDYIHGYVSFHQPVNWFVVALYPNQAASRPIAIFPLELHEGMVAGNRVKICRSLGLLYAVYTDYLVAPDHRADSLGALVQVLKQSFDCDALLFGLTHENSKNYLLLAESAARDECKIIRQKIAPYIDTRSIAFETLFAEKKKSTRADAQRCIRRLSEQGTLEFSTAPPDAAAIEALVSRHAEKFSGHHHNDSISANWQDFFRHIAGNETYRTIIDYSALKLNGSTIAAHLGFKGKGRRVYTLPIYDERFERYSPAKVLLYRLIETAYAEREVFCFGPALYPYKLDWCQATAELKFIWLFLTPKAKSLLPDRACGGLAGLFDG